MATKTKAAKGEQTENRMNNRTRIQKLVAAAKRVKERRKPHRSTGFNYARALEMLKGTPRYYTPESIMETMGCSRTTFYTIIPMLEKYHKAGEALWGCIKDEFPELFKGTSEEIRAKLMAAGLIDKDQAKGGRATGLAKRGHKTVE